MNGSIIWNEPRAEHRTRFDNAHRIDARQKMTPRRLEYLRLAANGFGNKEIAHALGVNINTVKNTFTAIFQILRVENRTEAVVEAFRRGLIK